MKSTPKTESPDQRTVKRYGNYLHPAITAYAYGGKARPFRARVAGGRADSSVSVHMGVLVDGLACPH